MLLEEARLGGSVGTANQTQRSTRNMGQHPFGNKSVVGREIPFGDFVVRVNDSLGMCNVDARR
jgi:hypothetical protein